MHVLPDDMKDIYGEVVTEAVSNQMQPGQKALDLGLDITNEWMGFSGVTFTLLQAGVTNLEEFKTAVDAELIRCANLFWQEDDATLAFYQSEAQKGGFTGGGLNEQLKKEVAEDFRVMLLTGILQPVFQRLSEENRMKQEQEYRAALAEVQRQMNQVVRLTVTEKTEIGKSPQHAGYYIRFGPLAEDADPTQWTGRINQQGKITASFTVLGHLQAGAPNHLFLYPNSQAMDDDKPSLILDFVVNMPETEIIIEHVDRQTKLIPVRTGEDLIGTLLFEEEDGYVSRYYLSDFPFPMEHLLVQEPIMIPENNVINITRSGGWSISDEGTAKDDIGWKATYEYQVEDLTLNINLTQNQKHPVIGGDGKVLFLAGTGTYQYQVTVATTLFQRCCSSGRIGMQLF